MEDHIILFLSVRELFGMFQNIISGVSIQRGDLGYSVCQSICTSSPGEQVWGAFLRFRDSATTTTHPVVFRSSMECQAPDLANLNAPGVSFANGQCKESRSAHMWGGGRQGVTGSMSCLRICFQSLLCIFQWKMTHTSSFTFQKARRTFVSILTRSLGKSSVWSRIRN